MNRLPRDEWLRRGESSSLQPARNSGASFLAQLDARAGMPLTFPRHNNRRVNRWSGVDKARCRGTLIHWACTWCGGGVCRCWCGPSAPGEKIITAISALYGPASHNNLFTSTIVHSLVPDGSKVPCGSPPPPLPPSSGRAGRIN